MNISGAREKIRILRVVTRLNIGGPAIHVVNLTAGLDPNRFESQLVCGTELAGEGSMLDLARERGLEPIQIPDIVNEFGLKAKDARAVRRLYRLMQELRPHIVHTHMAKAGFLGRLAARLAGVPVVVHTYHGHVLRGYFDPLRTRALRMMERWLGKMSQRLVAVSEQVKRELVEYGVAPAEKITVIPLGFDLQPLRQACKHRGEFRRECGISAEARLVGIVGRIFPIKNHRLFLESAARVARTMPEARFVIVGDGALRSEMEQLAASLGIGERTIFMGWRRDLPRIYADLDVLVVSSNNEGTPVAAIEAMAAGCPVVATRVGGLVDLIRDGETGWLVEPRNTEALSEAVVRVLNNHELAKRVASAAAGSVEERFNVRRLIGDVERLYEELTRKFLPSQTSS
jgi:glycosyltransferase involved in cell wall biosynthesis